MRKQLIIATGAASLCGAVQAHHGITGQFDTSTTFEVSGVVTRTKGRTALGDPDPGTRPILVLSRQN